MNLFTAGQNTRIVQPEYFFWAAVLFAFFLVVRSPENADRPSPEGGLALAAAAAHEETKPADPYAALDLKARAAIVYDAVTGETFYERNADEVLPLASLTKLMTAATALSLIPATTEITVTARAVAEEGDSGFLVGEKWLLRDLISLMLLESSNDAASAIAAASGAVAAGVESEEAGYAFFIDRMNSRARESGLLSTYFLNASGLDVTARMGGAYGTARELALILTRALSTFPNEFAETRFEELQVGNGNAEPRPVRNTNREANKFPLLIASKTGYTDLAGGNLALAFDAGFNHPIIVVVLGSTREGRLEDAERLVWAALQYLSQNL